LVYEEISPAVPKGFDYDVCNADILLNLMEVKDGRITTPSGMNYRVLVLPPGDRMTLPVLQKIAKLVRDGAVVYGPKPLRSPSLAGYPGVDQEIAKLAGEVWGNCDGKTVTQHAYGAGKVVWGEPLEKVLGVPADFTASQGNLLFTHRKDGETDIYFVSNQGKQAVTAECSFRVAGKGLQKRADARSALGLVPGQRPQSLRRTRQGRDSRIFQKRNHLHQQRAGNL
jgi:hypothetical protein